MTELEKLKATRDAAGADWAARAADAWAAEVAYEDADAAYEAELKKQEENSDD